MKSAAQRIAKYEARMVSSLLDPVIAARNAAQLENYTAYVVPFYQNQLQLRNLLNAAGLQTIDYAAYEAFHGEMFHLSKVAAGPSLIGATTTLIAKWKAVGFLGAGAEVLLKQIATDIYGVVIPVVP